MYRDIAHLCSKLALTKNASGTLKSVTLKALPAVSPVTLAVLCVVVYPRPTLFDNTWFIAVYTDQIDFY